MGGKVTVESCRNCKEWAGVGYNLVMAYCDVLKKDTDAFDYCTDWNHHK